MLVDSFKWILAAGVVMQPLRCRLSRAIVACAAAWTASTSAGWAQTLGEQVKLVPSDAAFQDIFGVGVSICGDTAVVGASSDDDAGSGSAHVFVRGGASWTEQAKLVASDAAGADFFGQSVAISGDTVVAGAWNDAHAGGTSAGSAYVFVRTGTSWAEQAKLVASDAAASDEFGRSLSMSGDTVLVGAVIAASAYVFERSGTSWTEQAKLVASDAAGFARFGGSVSISGDTAVVGAYFDNVGGIAAGSVYVFTRSGTSWTEQAKLVASDAADFDLFGFSVSSSGDTAVVGAFRDVHADGTNAGSAYVFVRSGTSWTEQAKLVASDAADGDEFGNSVSISGDTAVVGAWTDAHAGGFNAGSAYVYCAFAASATFRNAGSNPASYSANAPILGSTFIGMVDLAATGHAVAVLFGFDTPVTLVLPGGQVLLCLDQGGSGEFLGTPASVGPIATFSIPVPSDLDLVGFTLSTQALQLGFSVPFALSNAQDLVLGM